MSFLSFIGGVAEGYNEDEKAKAAAATKMKEIEMQAFLSALAADKKFQNQVALKQMDINAQQAIKDKELKLAGFKDDIEKAEAIGNGTITVGDGKVITIMKPSAWRAASDSEKLQESSRLFMYNLTEKEREEANQKLFALNTDPDRKAKGFAKENFGEEYFTNLTERYMISRDKQAVDPKTGLPIKLDRLTWMGGLDNYKDFYKQYLTKVDGRDTSYYNKPDQVGYLSRLENGNYEWITESDNADRDNPIDPSLAVSISPSLFVNPVSNDGASFDRYSNSLLESNEGSLLTPKEVFPIALHHMVNNINPGDSQRKNDIADVFDIGKRNTIQLQTYNPISQQVELVETKGGFDLINFRKNWYQAVHNKNSEFRNNNFVALDPKSFNTGGGGSEKAYQAGSQRIGAIENANAGLFAFLDVYMGLMNSGNINISEDAEGLVIDPLNPVGQFIGFLGGIFGTEGLVDQLNNIRAGGKALTGTLGVYAEDSVAESVRGAYKTLLDRQATGKSVLEALRVMIGYSAALITQGGDSQSARISDKDLQAGIDMTSGSAFTKPRDRVRLAYDFLKRNVPEYIALRLVDNANGWNYSQNFSRAKEYVTTYMNTPGDYYRSNPAVTNVMGAPYSVSNGFLLIDDNVAKKVRSYENFIYRDDFKDIYEVVDGAQKQETTVSDNTGGTAIPKIPTSSESNEQEGT